MITKLVKDQEKFWHQNYPSPKKFLKAETLKLSSCRGPAQVKWSLKSLITLSVGLSCYIELKLLMLYWDDFFPKRKKIGSELRIYDYIQYASFFKKYMDFVLFLSYVFKMLYFALQFPTILKKDFNVQALVSVNLVTRTAVKGKYFEWPCLEAKLCHLGFTNRSSVLDIYSAAFYEMTMTLSDTYNQDPLGSWT